MLPTLQTFLSELVEKQVDDVRLYLTPECKKKILYKCLESGEPIPVGPLVRFLEDQGIDVMEARRIRPSLEEVFVQVTGVEVDAMKKEKEKAGGGS